MNYNKLISYNNQSYTEIFHIIRRYITTVYPISKTDKGILVCIKVPQKDRAQHNSFSEEFTGNEFFELWIDKSGMSVELEQFVGYKESTKHSYIHGFIDNRFRKNLLNIFTTEGIFVWKKMMI